MSSNTSAIVLYDNAEWERNLNRKLTATAALIPIIDYNIRWSGSVMTTLENAFDQPIQIVSYCSWVLKLEKYGAIEMI
jgi:hypothetical protein